MASITLHLNTSLPQTAIYRLSATTQPSTLPSPGLRLVLWKKRPPSGQSLPQAPVNGFLTCIIFSHASSSSAFIFPPAIRSCARPLTERDSQSPISAWLQFSAICGMDVAHRSCSRPSERFNSHHK